MNFRRITSICLLVIYGLPAMVGPYWHSHGHSCADCCSSPSLCQDKIVPSKPHRFGECDGNCCFHKHSNATKVLGSQDSTPDKESEDGGDHHGHCVICDFYAKAYFAQVAFDLPTLSVCLPLYAESAIEAPSSPSVPSHARGPPTAC